MNPFEGDTCDVIAFPSELGWMALMGNDGKLRQIKFGFGSELKLLRSIDEPFDVCQPTSIQRSWISRLQKFTAGQKSDLQRIPVDLSGYTSFQFRVLKSCRSIPYGTTASYGQLATMIGSARAARAVGTTMKKNRFPLVIPCHRVVASNGIGGYSADNGVSIKTRLLAMEGVVF